MATAAHCAYCFESLAAHLENREALDYSQVKDLWQQFELQQRPEEARGDVTNRLRAEEHSGDASEEESDSAMTGTETGDENDEENDEDEDEGRGDTGSEKPGQNIIQPKPSSVRNGLRLPSISRLQAASPASASSSSTPSSTSASSSTAALGGNSKSSSSSSFFSFGRSKQPSPVAVPKEEQYPLFVTWNTVSSRTGHKSLRGCIGTFEPQELASGFRSYALTAALEDTRFSPVSLPELPSLSNSITLLSAFTPCAHPFDWEVGTHGIRISFSHHGKRYGATYLPDVAVEQGWNKEECLISLMRKAGWSGRKGDWNDVKGLSVVRYQGMKATLGWPEWKEWRDWVATR